MKQLQLLLFVMALAFPSNVVAQTVYTTKTGEKYHKSSCRYLKYSKKEITIDKAMELGYVACSVCKPTKDNTKASSAVTANAIVPKEQSEAPSKNTVATQCTGKTQAGKRCKRKTKNANGRCYQH
jgi:methylphosphotriester-DNA--protein-cysteine methyltransferase